MMKMISCILFIFFLIPGTISCDLSPGKKIEPDVVFVTTPHKVVREMLKLAGVTRDDIVYDLGSGDGRIVIAAAKDFGARGVGIEMDPELVAEGIENARKAGVAERVRFIKDDIFKTDIHGASVITMYLLPEVNKQLIPKLLQELKPGTRVVSHRFDAGDWKPDMILSAFDTTVYCWIIPVNAGGEWRITFKNEKETKEYMLSLRQHYQKITGTIRDDRREFKLQDAKLHGDEITIKIADTIAGRLFQMNMEGFVRGDTMEGTVFMTKDQSSGTYAWKGTRIVQ